MILGCGGRTPWRGTQHAFNLAAKRAVRKRLPGTGISPENPATVSVLSGS